MVGSLQDAIAVDNILAENISREIGTAEQRGVRHHAAERRVVPRVGVVVATASPGRVTVFAPNSSASWSTWAICARWSSDRRA